MNLKNRIKLAYNVIIGKKVCLPGMILTPPVPEVIFEARVNRYEARLNDRAQPYRNGDDFLPEEEVKRMLANQFLPFIIENMVVEKYVDKYKSPIPTVFYNAAIYIGKPKEEKHEKLSTRRG